jgi:hypothetical protein
MLLHVNIITGSDVVDQILSVLLGTNMFVGALVAFVLDNTVSGLFFTISS